MNWKNWLLLWDNKYWGRILSPNDVDGIVVVQWSDGSVADVHLFSKMIKALIKGGD